MRANAAARWSGRRADSIKLVAFPAALVAGSVGPTGVIHLSAQLAVVNAGPAPITVRTVTPVALTGSAWLSGHWIDCGG